MKSAKNQKTETKQKIQKNLAKQKSGQKKHEKFGCNAILRIRRGAAAPHVSLYTSV